MFYTYMLRCEDNSIYSGITTDLERRLEEHRSKTVKTAKYTLTHSALKFEAACESQTRSTASKLEFNLKKLTKAQKENIIKDENNFSKALGEKLNCEEYKRINL